MITDSQTELEKIFMSYDRVLYKLNLVGIKTKGGKEITHKDLRQAATIMNKKHPTCRWKQQKYRFKKYRNYILAEGFYWLIYVYFQTEKNIVDADIDFFNMRIGLYEDLLKISRKNFWNDDMYVYELPNYFNRVPGTIKNGIIKMNKTTNSLYKYYENGNLKKVLNGYARTVLNINIWNCLNNIKWNLQRYT